MATLWTFNNIQITVVDLKENSEQIIAKLQPIDEGTVYQTFGYINDTFPLQCFVVGSGDISALKALANTGTAYTLAGPGGFSKSCYLEKLTVQWMTSYAQSFREDKSRTDYVFKVGMELSEA
jgi:ABC-type transport system substrate-binding protein